MDPGHRTWPLDQRSAIFSQPVGVRDLYSSSTVDGCLAYDGCDGNPMDVTQMMAKWAKQFNQFSQMAESWGWGPKTKPIKNCQFQWDEHLPTLTWGSLRFTSYHSFDPDGSIVIWGQTLRPLPGLRSVAWCCWSSADGLAVRDSRNSTINLQYIVYDSIYII